MKKFSRTVFVMIVLLMGTNQTKAQKKILDEIRYEHTAADSMLTEFYNKIYGSFYNPTYRLNKIATFALLKIDIDKTGRINSIDFSDSADSSFVNSFAQRSQSEYDKVTLERYAKEKSYKDLSLLIPVIFEPNFPNQKKIFNYDELEGLLRFNKQNFTGKSVILSPIFIKVAVKGNM